MNDLSSVPSMSNEQQRTRRKYRYCQTLMYDISFRKYHKLIHVVWALRLRLRVLWEILPLQRLFQYGMSGGCIKWSRNYPCFASDVDNFSHGDLKSVAFSALIQPSNLCLWSGELCREQLQKSSNLFLRFDCKKIKCFRFDFFFLQLCVLILLHSNCTL